MRAWPIARPFRNRRVVASNSANPDREVHVAGIGDSRGHEEIYLIEAGEAGRPACIEWLDFLVIDEHDDVSIDIDNIAGGRRFIIGYAYSTKPSTPDDGGLSFLQGLGHTVVRLVSGSVVVLHDRHAAAARIACEDAEAAADNGHANRRA